MRKIISGMIIALLAISVFPLTLSVQLVKAVGGTIYIRADGSVDPPFAPIWNVGNLNVYYTFTANITDSIVVERDNIVVYGAGRVLEGAGTGRGIDLSGRSNVTVKSITIRKFGYGIYLSSSSGNTLYANKIINNTYSGIYLYESSGNSISINTITNNTYEGILLSVSSNSNSVSANTVTNNKYGIYLISSSNSNSIYANTITNNTGSGIILSLSSANSISANTITNNNYGTTLSSSSGNSISANTVTSNNCGIMLSSSSGNSMSANTITNNPNGIFLQSSSGNSISENTVANSYFGIRLDSANSNGISANTIANNSPDGLYLSSSSGNSISKNTITNNSNGTLLYSSSGNNIFENTITNNINGTSLINSSNNTITANTVTNNINGLYLYSSSSNLICHNNFIDNTAQAIATPGYANTWDDGYPSGGNYWSNYTGVDLYKGPNQNVAGSDEIGDIPYFWVGPGNWDYYPLMNPYIALTNVTSLVVRGNDNKVWYRSYSGGAWGTWYPIASATGDSVAAAMLGNNLHVVARDMSNTTLWHGYVNLATNVFSGWTLISGSPVSAPTLTSNGTALSLVVRGGDNRVWYRTYSGGVWGSWYPIASATGSSPAAAMIGNNLHIVARDMSGTQIWHGYVNLTTNVFSGWTLISGSPVSAPTLASNGTVLSLVVRGGDNKVWYRTYSGTWGSWYPIDAATGDSLGATMIGNNLHIVARDMAGTTLWHSYVNVATNAFSGWTLISGSTPSKPTLTS